MSECKVLVVDDSALMRKIITDILQRDKDLKVVGYAVNGADGIEKVKELQPDVVTLDIEMPIMNGLEMLEKLIPNYPIPVVVLSSLTTDGAEATLKALDLGAVDFITKPKNLSAVEGEKTVTEILWKIKVASKINRAKIRPRKRIFALVKKHPVSSFAPISYGEKYKFALIGTSTGGPSALQELIPHLPVDFPLGLVVVQHMPVGFTKSLAQRLDNLSQLHVKEADNGEPILPGKVLLAPAGKHLIIEKKGGHFVTVLRDTIDIKTQFRPSVDGMMLSAAKLHVPVLAVIMTGMGYDGTKGMQALKLSDSYNIAQDEESCVVYGMPRSAVEAGIVDVISPLKSIAEVMNKVVRKK